LLADAFEHHVWATVQLIDACLSVSTEQLETPVPGTYGSIRDTMRHLVDGDSTYLFWLTGDRAHVIETDGMDLRQLREAIERNGVAWSAFLAQDPNAEQIVKDVDDGEGWERDASVGVRLAQALHHGSEHRSQICTTLTTLGVQPPELDLWDFGLDTGRIVEVLPP
jgi:uncharacterized damage-inducible protein DinB